MREMMRLPERIAHYVFGSAYLMTHLLTFERRYPPLGT